MKVNANFINNEKIEGYVYGLGNNFRELSEKVSKKGVKYIGGDLHVAVDEAGLNVITVSYIYVTETTKSGSPNRTYSTLKKIIDTPEKHWVNSGKENAFKVSCTAVRVGVNDFIGSDGTKVAEIRNEGGFCTIVDELCPEDERNTFSTDILITNVKRIEANPERNIDEEYGTINGCVFGFGQPPTIIPVSFAVRNESGIKFFEDMEPSSSEPVFTKVWGRINSLTVTYTKTEESAFGEAAVQTVKRKTKEYVVTGTSKVPYDFGDEEVLTSEDVNTMIQNRQVKLAEVEKRYNDSKEVKATNKNSSVMTEVPVGDFVF